MTVRLKLFHVHRLLGASLVFGSVAHARIFPEERDRSVWDRGCRDWPVHLPGNYAGVTERNPSTYIEKSGGFLRVFAKMTVSPEKGESLDELLGSVEQKLSDGFTYPKWTLPGINEKPGGGRYFVSVDGLNVLEREPKVDFVLTGPFSFQILWFKRSGASSLEFRSEKAQMPSCDLFAPLLKRGEKLAHRLTYRMTPREDLLKLLMAEIWVFPLKGRVEVRLRLAAQPASLVYQLMPASLVKSELDVRGRRLFENFLDFRRAAVLAKGSSAASARPTSKSVAPPKSGR